MKTILITGASAGIGAACARTFLDHGWRVGLLARGEAALTQVADGKANAIVLPCDVTDPDSVDAAFDRFVDWAGRLDVLFNNAGMFGSAAPIDEISVEEWNLVRSVNLDGMFYCARAAFARMRAQNPQGGRIINNGSISAHVPREGSVTYTTTKHAITGLTRTLSLDGRAFDIACGQIDIGNARTELLEGIIARNPDNPPPTMSVDDVAKAVLQMAELAPEANVQFLTLMATKMPYIGRG
ncbi:Glucose 1-dehydrogenase 2 [Thalassovita gelatinovora]|uniref:Glucose 1-dehydrogenase 2 n=1 Tax=Thalassovita gelatinovora TaxID=53501 RepID=A0A0P1FCH5_THAGE|nr:SDR family oxidoreductase [Thalassovita gelatinovora]QIZ80480.1 SDR family oxidoreductase [Thalassovita gelatinovora]CUH65918.1 Glucose 1-dehydrogenase 2 [Thalassovita gelatinovora]SEQ73729.1 NADP-dependent 3-hydroxy acid dehydrogenase YdfG [Thalassovita gelatinovora]